MKQRALLTLGQGDWQQGFASITLQLWEASSSSPVQFSGSLPAAPELGQTFQQWRSLYAALYGNCGIWRRSFSSDAAASGAGFPIEIDDEGVTHVSVTEFIQLGQDLRQQLNGWLESSAFRSVERQLRTHLSRSDEIRIILAAQSQAVLRYPWHLWQLLEDYPQAELALSPIDYQRSIKKPQTKTPSQVSVLAVIGNAHGIDVATDQQLLSALPRAAVTLLAEPTLDELNQQLWQGTWDVLFFAGHSSSRTEGVLQLNRRDTITLAQLKYGLRNAIAQGLQLAIFNSCDGLGLACALADLNIPQVIVMREPVPDGVAHAFLKHFLTAFSSNQPLYLAVRAAREQLQPLESLCPCATWLPVIVQNPAELPISWQALQGNPIPATAPAAPPTKLLPAREWRSLWAPLAATATVVGLRLLGALEPVELYAFDRLMRLRPAEPPDPRFLVVALSEADIRAQPADRRGSLSDESLSQLLLTLDRYQARVVGLDIYRDYPVSPTAPQLAMQLSSGNLVGVCKSRDPTVDPIGVDPPPELAEDLVGFSDFLDDSDGVVRRHLIGLEADPAATCTTSYAFSARLAFIYLQSEGITPSFDADGNLVMGEAVFPRLHRRSGGYQPMDAGGNQILLNYRALPSPSAIANQVSLTQMLSGQVNPGAIADRIVLIGVTANSLTDDWATPYGASSGDKTSGVFLQAQMTSQLISAALGERPALRVWPLWGGVLWIGIWAVLGWGVADLMQSLGGQRQWGLVLSGLGLGLLLGGSLWLLVGGVWVPLVPAALAFVGSGFATVRWGRPHQT
ncbi:MAG: CHASE2 domain-containing protein [Elainellaceae cyanobacterium]